MPLLRNYLLSFLLGVFSLSFSETHGGIELGLGVGKTYLEKESSWATFTHIHITKDFYEKIFAGLSFEHIFDEHEHGILSLAFGYRFSQLSLSYMPGFYLYGGSGLVHHIELVYTLEFKGIHFGPLISASFGEENHYSVGLHLGYSF